MYDLVNNRRIIPEINGNRLLVYLPPSNTERELFLVSGNAVRSVDTLYKRQFDVFDFENEAFDYVLLSHPKLIDDPNGYVQAYVEHRASALGGNFNPVVVDITQV